MPPLIREELEARYMARRNRSLAEHGFDIDPDGFLFALNDTFDSMYANVLPSLDELLVRPTEAIRFCAVVRERLREPDLPEYLILRTILNFRKHG
jgi:hypothetical protein